MESEGASSPWRYWERARGRHGCEGSRALGFKVIACGNGSLVSGSSRCGFSDISAAGFSLCAALLVRMAARGVAITQDNREKERRARGQGRGNVPPSSLWIRMHHQMPGLNI